MIARFEDTRDLRLMGGYHAGHRCRSSTAPSPSCRASTTRCGRTRPASPSADVFAELAQLLRARSATASRKPPRAIAVMTTVPLRIEDNPHEPLWRARAPASPA